MMRAIKQLILAAAAILTSSVCSAAETKVSLDMVQKLKSEIARHSQGQVSVDAVSGTPITGIYEIVSGDEVFYSDSTGKYAFVDGRLVDLRNKDDLTQRTLDRITSIDFNRLPLHLAFKTVQGKGDRRIAVFEDPTCGVCKVLHKFIAQIPNLTVYTFPYPIASPDALPLAQTAWCSRDRGKQWKAIMDGVRPEANKNCDMKDLQTVLELGDDLRINGTPTVFLSNGRRLVGAVPPNQFIKAIDEIR